MTKQELAAKIWATANALRKNIKASEYKDYILGFMFYKYLCDKELDYLKDLGGELEDLRDVDESTKDKFKDGIGYFIQHGNMFSVWKDAGVSLGAKDVSEALDDFYANLNGKYKSVFKDVFSALQAGLAKLGENAGSRDKAVRDIVDLVYLIPPTSRNFDVLGYIYEYLIQQFSSEAKKDGAFYTPHELTSLMARIIAERLRDRDGICCYDPTVGTAGLLLNIGREAGRYITRDRIRYYGQELITETANLAKMNLFMQGVPVQNIYMRNANTLEDDWPYFDEKTPYAPLFVDAVVSNPPYSAHYDSSSLQTDERFKGYGLAPEGKADYAFLLHCLYHIKKGGIMAIVLPHGVLFRGDSEGKIRKNLILNHNIEAIISMPGQLFFATPIPVIVMILSKGREESDVLFVDASQSFKKGKKQNVLRESDVQRIFDAVTARRDIPHYAHLASLNEIKENDYNLNVPRYVSASQEDAPYDPYSVMTGKVSDKELEAFDEFWERFPALRGRLLANKDGYNGFLEADCREAVFDDADVKKYISDCRAVSEGFREYLAGKLISPDAGAFVHAEIAEKLFETFKGQPLTDIYDIFQAFSDGWETIEADLQRIEGEGWGICSETEPNMVARKDPKTKQTIEEQKGWKGKIFPFDLIKSEYFHEAFEEIHALTREADADASSYADIWENMDEDAKAQVLKDGDDAAYDAKKFKGAIKGGSLDKESAEGLKEMQRLMDSEKGLRKKAKAMASALDDKAKEKIESLKDDEIRGLLGKKWVIPVIDGINDVAKGVIEGFVSRFNQLREKYADPLEDLSARIDEAGEELAGSLRHLTGSQTDMAAVGMLLKELEGNSNEYEK